jgi:hypothetical protein
MQKERRMKGAKFLTVGLVFGLAASANAVNQVWFEATSGPGSPLGAAGTKLTLPSLGSYNITALMTTDQPVLSWGLNFSAPAALTFSACDVNNNPFTTVLNEGTCGAGFWTEAAAVSGTPIAPGARFILGTFTLTATAGGDVTVSVNNGEFSGPDFSYPPTQFGDGAAIEGFAGTPIANPVITVIPEPATLVLLGLGAMALIRRRAAR